MAQSFRTAISFDGLASASSQALAIKVDGDTQNRVLIDAGGKITWGAGGSSAGDTTLYRSAANNLKTDDTFEASGLTVSGDAAFDTDTLFVDVSEDRVGIGTASPAHPLDVVGQARFSSSVQFNNGDQVIRTWGSGAIDNLLPGSAFGGILEGNSSGHFVMGIRDDDANDSFSVISGGGDQTTNGYDTVVAYFGANGEVGIGTSSPDRQLDIEGNVPAVRLTDSNNAGVYHEILGDGASLSIEADDNDQAADSSINFKVDGSQKATITSDGRLGIGTTSPEQALHVNSGTTNLGVLIESTNAGALLGLKDDTTSGNSYVGLRADGDILKLRAGNTNQVVIQANGNTSFEGNVTVPSLTLGSTAVTATAAELNILDGVTATASELNILDGVTSTTAELNILDGVTSTASELNLVDGITAGTVSASKAVIADSNKDVTGFRNVTATGIVDAVNFKVNGGQGSDGQVLTSTGSGVAWEDATGGGGSPGGSDGQIQYNNGSAFGGASDLHYDDGNDRLGIGTTSPGAKFHVNGGTSDTNIRVTSTDAGAYIGFDDSTTTGDWWRQRVGVQGNDIVIQTNGSTRMTVDSSGNVGINDTTPSFQLDVNGTGQFTDDLTLGGDLNYGNNAIIANNGGSSNIDHIWHNDSSNEWNFCSDTTYKATGNSTLRAGTVTVSTANATTVNLNTSVHLTNVDADGSMRVQGNSGYIDIGPKNSSYCHIYTDRGSFYFNKETLYANSTSNKIWHRGDLRGGAVSVALDGSGYGSISHGLGTTPDFAFVGARTRLSSDNDNQLAFPVTSANSSTITFRAYEINGNGNSNYTSSTIYSATVYVYWVAGDM